MKKIKIKKNKNVEIFKFFWNIKNLLRF